MLEAIEPVSRTPLARFRERGEGGRLLVLRVKGLTDQQRGAVVAAARRHLGKPYDPLFTPGDDRLYCSELVRLVFLEGAGIELGTMQPLGSLDLAPVQEALRARYGDRIPLQQPLVTPASIAADAKLERVAGP